MTRWILPLPLNHRGSLQFLRLSETLPRQAMTLRCITWPLARQHSTIICAIKQRLQSLLLYVARIISSTPQSQGFTPFARPTLFRGSRWQGQRYLETRYIPYFPDAELGNFLRCWGFCHGFIANKSSITSISRTVEQPMIICSIYIYLAVILPYTLTLKLQQPGHDPECVLFTSSIINRVLSPPTASSHWALGWKPFGFWGFVSRLYLKQSNPTKPSSLIFSFELCIY